MKADFEKLLPLDFDSIVAAHSLPIESGAKEALNHEFRRVFLCGYLTDRLGQGTACR